MDGFDAGSVRVSLGFDLDDRQLKVYDRQYTEAKAKQDIKTGVRFDYDQRAFAAFMRDRGELERMRPVHLEVKVDVDTSKLAGLRRDVQNSERDVQSFGRTAGQAFGIVSSSMGDASIGAGRFSASLVGIVALAPGIAALAGVVTALAGSLSAAVAGAGALGVGLGATFAPVIALAAGAMSRLSDITKVYQAQQAATLADQTKAGQAHQKTTTAINALAGATDSLKNANVGVLDARHAVTTAERDYSKAIADSQAKIGSARDAEVKAARDVTDAQRKLAQAREDARRAQQDQQRAVEDASLSQADAIARRNQLQAAGDTSGRAFFDAQRQVDQTTLDAARAQADNQAYLDRGARAFQPLDDALRTLADTTKVYHQRQHDLIVLERQGLAQAPAVIAAVDRIRLARENLTRAVRAQHAAERGVSTAQATSQAPMGFDTGQAKANALFGALDAVDKHLLATGKRIIDSFEGAVKGGVDAIFTGLDHGLQRVPGMLKKLTPDLTALGKTIGGVLDGFLRNLTSPEWTRAWQTFTQAARPIVKDFGRTFTDVANILRDIAIAVLPDLKSILKDVADWMDAFAGKVHRSLGDGSLQKTIHGLVRSFKDWMGLIGQVSLLLISIFSGGKKSGDDMVVSLTNTVKKWREWIDSNPEKVHKFFKDAKDLVEKVAKVIAPVVEGFLKMVTAAMEFFSKVPPGVFQAFGAMWAGLALLKFTGLLKVLGLMKDVIGKKFPSLPGFGGKPTSVPAGGPGEPGVVPGDTGPRVPGEVRSPGGVILPGRAGEAPVEPVRTPLRGGGVRGVGVASVAAIVAQVVIDPKSTAGHILFGPDAKQQGDTNGKLFMDAFSDQIDKYAKGGNIKGLRSIQDQVKRTIDANKDADPTALLKVSKAIDILVASSKHLHDVRDVSRRVQDGFAALEVGGGGSIKQLRAVVAENTGLIKDRLGSDSLAGVQALNLNFKDAVGWVHDHMSAAGKLTREGMAEIRKLLRQHLADFGITGKQADRYMRGEDPLTGKPMNVGNKASGGWIGTPGERGGDTVPVMLGRGEAVLNHYQQAAVNAALQLSGMAPGGLDDLFDATAHTRHYMAAGGYASGGHPSWSGGLLSGLNHAFPAHTLANTAGHFQMSPAQVMAVAQWAGLPGRTFEEIAHGESSYFPGIIGHDPGGTLGYGLFQNTTSVNGPLFEALVRKLGGWAQQLNPFKNATAAKWLYDRGGLSHWFGTRYLGHPNNTGGGGNPAAQPGSGHPRSIGAPNIGGGLLGGIVQGALSAYTRGANAILGNAASPTVPGGVAGPAGGPAGLGTFDGRPVAKWIIPELNYARAHGWTGHISSGWRSPTQVVRSSVVAPQGMSEHQGTQYPHGAVDFGGPFDAAGLANKLAFMRATLGYSGRRLLAAIGFRDDGHMSGTGHAAGRKGAIKAVPSKHPAATPAPVASFNPPGSHTSAPASWQSRFAQYAQHGTLSSGLFNTVQFAIGAADHLGGADMSYRSLLGTPDSPPAGYRSITGDLADLQVSYQIGNREYGQMKPDDPRRSGKLAALQQIQKNIAGKVREQAEKVRAIIGAYQEAWRRLYLVIPYATAPVKKALLGVASGYIDTINQWGGVLHGLTGETIPNADLDVSDTGIAIDDLTATPGPDLQAQLAQAQAQIGALTKSNQISTAAVTAFGSPGDIGTGNFSNAYNAAANRAFNPAAMANQAGGGDTHYHATVNISSVETPSPAQALRLANHVVAGLDYQPSVQSPRERLGV